MDDAGTLGLANCRREIEELHAFFVGWYTGRRDDFERMKRAIGQGFEMVTPDGDCLGREAVLAMVHDGNDQYDPGEFDIEIRNVAAVDTGSDHALVRYEEWQSGPEGQDGRLSSVLFRPGKDAPRSIVWAGLHETWLRD
jgi:hypothetical protein